MLLLSFSGVASAGDYEDGLEAAMRDDYVEAARLFKRAADQGNADAQLYLGMLYREGKGLPRNDDESGVRFRKAAEQGSSEAQFNLGLMYYEGNGVPQDLAESARWYRLAARQGNGYAQTNLAHLYAEGLGVNRDDVRAHAWLYLAATSEDQIVAESAESMMNDLATQMSQDGILAAQNYAKACLANNYRDCD
jgi:TPR repeat protein